MPIAPLAISMLPTSVMISSAYFGKSRQRRGHSTTRLGAQQQRLRDRDAERARATLRLTVRSSLVGRSIGRSPGARP